MKVYFFNTSILTSYGIYSYKKRTLIDIKFCLGIDLDNNYEPISAIGHESTAQIMSALLDYPIKVNRIQAKMEPGDCAYIFKMKGRPPEGKILSCEEIEEIGYEWGYLEMIRTE